MSELYDFREYAPDYVLVGEFGRWVDVHPQERLQAAGYELIESLGQYELFHRQACKLNPGSPDRQRHRY